MNNDGYNFKQFFPKSPKILVRRGYISVSKFAREKLGSAVDIFLDKEKNAIMLLKNRESTNEIKEYRKGAGGMILRSIKMPEGKYRMKEELKDGFIFVKA